MFGLSIEELWRRCQNKLFMGVLLALIIFWEYRRGYFKGTKNYLKSVSFKPYYTPLLFFMVLIILLFFLDPALLRGIQALDSPYIQGMSDFGAQISRNLWIGLIGAYWISFLTNQKRFCRFVFGMFLSTALTGLVGHGLKLVFLRARPYGNLGPFSFFNLGGLTQNDRVFQSLPSGDVSITAGATCYLFYALRGNYFRWFVLLIPLSTAFSRVDLNRHWPSDTLAAIGVGIIVAQWMVNYEQRARAIIN